MSGRITITFDPAEGAVQRMVGLIERRGFRLRGLVMSEEASEATIRMDVEGRDPSRRIDIVVRQLERLVDVRTVQCSTAEAGPIA